MHALMAFLIGLVRWPYDAVFSEQGWLGSLWFESARSRALLLGMPAVLLAIAGLVLLCVAEFGMAGSLESKYRTRVEASVDQKQELTQELNKELEQLRLSVEGEGSREVDDLIPPDDDRRQTLLKYQQEEQIYLRKLNSLNPDEPEYLFQLAQLMLSQQNIDEGLAMLRKLAPEDEPGYTPAHLFLARFLLGLRTQRPEAARVNRREALLHINQALLRDQNNPIAVNLKAIVLYQSGALAEAYQQFEKVFESDPRAYVPLIEINTRLNRESLNPPVLRSATERFRLQLQNMGRDNPKRLNTLVDLTNCYRKQGDYETAERFLRQEIEAYEAEEENREKAAVVKRLLGSVFLGWVATFEVDTVEGQRERLKFLQQAFELDPLNADVLRQLTRLGASPDAELAAAARATYDAAAQVNPPAAVLNELGIQALSRSEYDQALRLFSDARQQAPRDPEVLNNLAYTHLKSSSPNPRLALKLIDEAIRNTPQVTLQSAYRSNFLDTRARALMQLKQWNAAIADFTKALVDRPDNVDILQAIVECYRANELETEAEIWQARLDAARAAAAGSGAAPSQ